jgi:hypothetical protein
LYILQFEWLDSKMIETFSLFRNSDRTPHRVSKQLYMGLLHFVFDLESRGGGMSLRTAGYDADLFLCSLGTAGSTWKQIAARDFPPKHDLSFCCYKLYGNIYQSFYSAHFVIL